jgi:hypothetical protein
MITMRNIIMMITMRNIIMIIIMDMVITQGKKKAFSPICLTSKLNKMDLIGKATIHTAVFYSGKIAGYITWIVI